MKLKKSGNKKQKKAVAKKASELIENEMVLGLGTGSTVGYLIQELGKKNKTSLSAICSSYQTKKRAIRQGISITSFDEIKEIDLTIDGADQVDEDLNLIKGGGAAHFREKIIANYSNEFVCIVDETKKTKKLNDPVPIEVHSFSKKPIQNYLQKKAKKVEIRESKEKDGPLITDNGNLVIDTYFGEIKKPKKLNKELNNLPGIIEHGLFTQMVDKLYLGKSKEVKTITR